MNSDDMRTQQYIETLKSRLKVAKMSVCDIDSMIKSLGNTENESKVDKIRDSIMDLKMFLEEKV